MKQTGIVQVDPASLYKDVLANAVLVILLLSAAGCGKQATERFSGLGSGTTYQVEIPLAYPSRLVAEIEELNEPLHPDEKVLGNSGDGIRKRFRSLVYEDGEGSRIPLDTKGMGNPDGYGDAFYYKRNSKNPQSLHLMTHIFTEGDSYYLAKWVVRGNVSERVVLSDDPRMQDTETKASWAHADKRVPITMRTEFLSDESFYPLRFMPSQVFTNMIRVKMDIPPNSLSLKYRFDVRIPQNVRLDEEGQRTGKIRLRASLATSDYSSRSIYDHVLPALSNWSTVSGSFSLTQDSCRVLYIEPYGINGTPEYKDIKISLEK